MPANLQDWVPDDDASTTQPVQSRGTAGDGWVEDNEEDEAPAAPAQKRSFLGGLVTQDPDKNKFAKNGIFATLLNEFTKKPDPEAKAMMESLGYPGGLVSDAGIEALKRLTGNGGLGANEWN